MTETQGLNPAWKPLLDALPEPLHAVVTPHLQTWDKNFQDKLQEVRSEYSSYEEIKKAGIDPDLIKKSLYLYDQFATDPEEVIKQAIEAYELPYVDKANVQQTTDNELEDFDMDDTSDITKHPQFAALMEQVQGLQQTAEQREQAEQQAEAVKQHMAWLEEMQKPEKYGEFDTEYVTALMSQGLDGEEAIKRYQTKFANKAADALVPNQQQQTQPPVVMGGDGTVGSGLPENPVNFGDMKTADFNDTVIKMLEAQQQDNNQG